MSGPSAVEKEQCPGCGAAIDEARVAAQGVIQRFGCFRCGLQLVRRPGQGWAAVRG